MAAANPANYGPPETPIPTQAEYDVIRNNLINQGWVAGNIEYDWGDGRMPGLFRQDEMTDYQRVRKPNGMWVLFERDIGYNQGMVNLQGNNNNIGQNYNNNQNINQGGRKRYKQKKTKKNKKSRKRRRTRKHK